MTARRSKIGFDGRRSPVSILRRVTRAQPICCASSSCVRSSARRRRFSHKPNGRLSPSMIASMRSDMCGPSSQYVLYTISVLYHILYCQV